MAFGELSKLAKLTVAGFRAAKRQDPQDLIDKFEVQYNPESLTLTHASVLKSQQGAGPLSCEGGFAYSRPKRLSVDLVVDGTTVSHFGVERLRHLPTVAERVQQFLAVCYFPQGEIHEPAYLKLSWGQLSWGHGLLEPSFDCRLESVQVQYTAFERDGSPLHAKLTAVFVEHLEAPKQAQKANLSSPDLTHRRVVVAGDTLPLLCRQIYGSPAHYLRVAQANGLEDFRDLTPGQELFFPPFDRARHG